VIIIIIDFESCCQIAALKTAFKNQSLIHAILFLVEGVNTLQVYETLLSSTATNLTLIGSTWILDCLTILQDSSYVNQVLFQHFILSVPWLMILGREIKC
jgi:hypothetical protein